MRFKLYHQLPVTNYFNRQTGLTALLLVIAGSAALLILVMSAVFLGLSEAERNILARQQAKATAVADSCLAEVSIRLQHDFTASLPPAFALAESAGDCIIMEEIIASDQKQVMVTGQTDLAVVKINAVIIQSGEDVLLADWKITD